MINVTKDGHIDIMVGRSRFEKRWLHKELKWSALVNKLSKTHRTAETYKEYMKAKPERQDEIKDIGGFVGGLMSGGRRKNGSIIHRQLITLDADHDPNIEEFNEISIEKKLAVCTYSTHKHALEKARLRIIIPLLRPVDIYEYEAISRKVADWYGIDYFDITTFQPTRLMYWPSTSKDGTFHFDYKDGNWLNADKVLALYEDWQDSTQWPVSSKEKEKVKTLTKKQADPLEKVGMIGSWCRTHTIHDVIEKYLSDVYEPGTIVDRYTYKEGTTVNGLAVYDDVFAYSHHSTDPCSGILCNAWDLVRIHKFGLLDEDKEDKKASAKAMQELAALDVEVKTTIGREKLDEARNLFEDMEQEEEVIQADNPDAWLKKMEVDDKANYLNTINNVVLILMNDPAFKGRLRLDDMKKAYIVEGKLPWRGVEGKQTQWIDSDYADLRHYLELIYRITSATKIGDAVAIVMGKNVFHPVREWIKPLEWDGTKRAETLFIDYLGVNDTHYARMVTRKSLLACIYRAFEPGCKFDNMVVLIGEQGIGKSTIIRRLGHKWFSDTLNDIGSTKSFEQLQGKWIVELSELASLRNAEVETTKHFLRKQEDFYRPSYGKVAQDFLRQCVFFGSTNKFQFLKDVTGNRSFWPLVCDLGKATEDVFEYFTLSEVEQVWAEVYTWYMLGEATHLSLDTEAAARKVQAQHMEEDERLGMVEEFLELPLPEDWAKMNHWEKRGYLDSEELQNGKVQRATISAIELYVELFRGNYKDFNTRIGREMTHLLKQLSGWECNEQKIKVPSYGRQKVFQRIEKTKIER